MRLTQWTDYTLRVLMYCAASQARQRAVTISEIAQAHAISRSHLTKIVHELSARGLLQTMRGRGGGIRLAMPAKDIRIGDVVREAETDFKLVECFDAERNECRLDRHCRLKGVLRTALDSYLKVLDGVTLADLVAPAAVAGGPPAVRKAGLMPGLPVSRH